LTKQIDLYCLPFGAGNKYGYRRYEACAQRGLRLTVLEYPGRASRSSQPLLTNAYDLAADMYAELKKGFQGKPYALYGHSMGGLMAHLLTKEIVAAQEIPPPLHLFITGCAGPAARGRADRTVLNRYKMPQEELLAEARKLEGFPPDILLDNDMMDYIAPIMRADFEVSETYNYQPDEPYDIPILVITGNKEPLKREDVRTWQQETLQPVVYKQLPGKHFFIHTYPAEIMATIAHALQAKQALLL
jgi:surfactin synthase thioesterase subunit